ncbi:MAG: hypothetical protein M3N28_05715, partial [Actinomycetota bacterium]|nr:hypothetical protein [Actinomycetota bacterium]
PPPAGDPAPAQPSDAEPNPPPPAGPVEEPPAAVGGPAADLEPPTPPPPSPPKQVAAGKADGANPQRLTAGDTLLMLGLVVAVFVLLVVEWRSPYSSLRHATSRLGRGRW